MNDCSKRITWTSLQKTIESLNDLNAFSVLQVGCGTGQCAIELLRNGAQRVVVIDTDAACIERARKRVHEAGAAERSEFVVSNILEDPITETFDLVISLGLFREEVPEPGRVLARMAELSHNKVMADFEHSGVGGAPWRTLQRWMGWRARRYYTSEEVRQLGHEARLSKFRIERIGKSTYFLTGNGTGRPQTAQTRCSAV